MPASSAHHRPVLMGQIRSCFTTLAAAVLVVAAGMLCAVDGAEAQYRRPSFLEQLFGGGGFQQPPPQYQQRPQTHSSQPQQTDSSRAPPPRKSDKTETPPSTTVMVFGDSFADWLGYGLEDSLSDTPEVGVVRKNKTFSGLIRYEARGDLDWPNVVRDTLSKEKADFVVIMLGLSDRQAIREAPRKKDDKKDAKKDDKAKDEKAKEEKKDDKDSKDAKKDGAADDKPASAANDADDEGEQPNIAAPERTTRAPGGSAEVRSDRWAELYSRKIDEMIAAAKSRGVPVIWVGLPSLRGTRSTSDALYLNDLYRSRALKAGIVYVDVWDGFVDENNRYSLHGPD
ncbi:MAG: SGNH/GDSL hydrolase family protein, partial [Pseudolabrys sp.]